MNYLYKITYSDNEIFLGGDILNSKWNLIANKPIKELEYKIGNKTIHMEGYEEYNHLIVHQTILNTKQERITSILLLGATGKKIDVIDIDLNKNTITKYEKIKGKEFKNSGTTGWKQGTKTIPYFVII